ncbi:MAG: hypothetical protein IJZ29_04080 [Clostridia bacterium]|nr:hypothetical protein [Clostridia bacterium]
MKKFRKILLSVCLCFTMFALVSCGETGLGSMPKTDDMVTGNGNLAVTKGEYVYFVDSYVTSTDLGKNDNNQGEVKTSALYRTKLKEDKLDVDEKGNLKTYELVVSKVVGTQNTGLFIFDDYIYYGTPNMQNDREGKLRTDLIDFCRAKLDGTNIEVLYTTEQYSAGATYSFYKIGGSVYLVVFDGKDIKQIEITSYAKNAVTLASNVASVMMPKITDYAYTKNYQTTGTQGYVYYTRNVTENDFINTSNKGNVLGKVNITKKDEKEERVDGVTTYELKSVESNYVYAYKTVNSNKCLYAINNVANTSTDIQITATDDYTNEFVLPNVNGENLGVIVTYGGKTIWVKDGLNTSTNSVVISDAEYTINYCDGRYAYYLNGTKMYRIDLTNTNLDENVELVFDETNIDTTYLDFDEEGYIYYFNTYTGDSGKSQKYLKRVDLSSKIQPEENEEETDLGYKTELVGVLKNKHTKVEI